MSILGLCLAVLTIYAFAAPDTDKDYGDFLSIAGGVLGVGVIATAMQAASSLTPTR